MHSFAFTAEAPAGDMPAGIGHLPIYTHSLFIIVNKP